jgi:hypothetical protein
MFLIERNFAEEIKLDPDDPQVREINDDVGVRWLYSFLSLDRKKTYCLYEAPSAEAVREAARRANIPADVVIQVDSPVGPGLVPATG